MKPTSRVRTWTLPRKVVVPEGMEIMQTVGTVRCIDCGAQVTWMRKTSGNGRGRPMNDDGTPHRKTCPDKPKWRFHWGRGHPKPKGEDR